MSVARQTLPRSLPERNLRALRDGLTLARRNIIKIKRVPDLLVFSTLSPIMFVLLFAYVFGSAIDVPGTSYREFLLPGIFAQTVIFGSTNTGVGLAPDLQRGIIDRFRSLPTTRSAVLVGRTTSDHHGRATVARRPSAMSSSPRPIASRRSGPACSRG